MLEIFIENYSMLSNKEIKNLISELLEIGHEPSTRELSRVLRKHPKGDGFYSKSEIIEMAESIGESEELLELKKILRMKPTRTVSGVAPVTIFTKPYECPGECIFCPSQADMPKSYLREEPGAMRAESLKFDPYNQVQKRIQALENIGHNTEKVEIIISGGTWSHYEKEYREWFIVEMFKALNDLPRSYGVIPDSDPGSRSSQNFQTEEQKTNLLYELQKLNESAKHKCVGLVIETRPDYVTEEEIKHLRKLGVTKVQLGVQTLDDKVLEMNRRGHTSEDSQEAANLLRLAGFKLHIHWMPNLYDSDIENDYEDFLRIYEENSIQPDEIKIYPCSVLEHTPLYQLMKEGKYKPYKEDDLIELLAQCKTKIPEYGRITRLFRDIPSQLIMAGTTKTNLRQIVQEYMKGKGMSCNCIRCREIKLGKFKWEDLQLKIMKYQTKVSEEFFISYETDEGKIVGFLRLSLPKKELSKEHFIKELRNSAIIREVHVYGRALKTDAAGETQHIGIGKTLIEKALELAREKDYEKLSVISAIGTREYYRKNGFQDGTLYQHIKLSSRTRLPSSGGEMS